MTREEQAKLNEHLLEAATSGNNAEVGRLLNSGANVNAVDTFGNTPLHRAARFGHTEVVQELLAARANIHAIAITKETPLHDAAKWGNLKTVEQLIAAGADVNAIDIDEQTPLHDAASEGHTEAAKALIAAGADVHAIDIDGQTPLHDAAKWGHLGTVKQLIAAGANVNVQDKYKQTPLHLAAFVGKPEIVEALIEKEANVNVQDKDGRTPLDMLTIKPSDLIRNLEYYNTAQKLIVAGADVNRLLDNALAKDTKVYDYFISAVAEVIIATEVPQKFNKRIGNRSEKSTPLLQDYKEKSGIKLENIQEKHRGAVRKKIDILKKARKVASYAAQVTARAAGEDQQAGCAIS